MRVGRRGPIVRLLESHVSKGRDTGCPCIMGSQMWAMRVLVCGAGKQQQIAIGIFDDEIPGAPGLLFQRLEEADSSALKFQKQ